MPAAAATATGAEWPSDACVKQGIIPASECALILSGDALLRGAPPNVVAVEAPLSAIPLSRHVRGAPAIWYAEQYERQTQTGLVMRFVGGGTVFFESLGIMTGKVKTHDADGRTNRTTATVAASGVAVWLASAGLRKLARRNGERAVAEYNRTLTF